MSTYNLRKTYAVIPKCCGTSFGGFDSNGSSSLWGQADSIDCAISTGYGLILGARRIDLANNLNKNKGLGSLEIRNSRFQVETLVSGNKVQLTNLNRVFCTVNSNASQIPQANCPLDVTGNEPSNATELIRRNFSMPHVPYPTASTFPLVVNNNLPNGEGTNELTKPLQDLGNGRSYKNKTATFARMRICDRSLDNSNWVDFNNGQGGGQGGGKGGGKGGGISASGYDISEARSQISTTVNTNDASFAEPNLGCRITVTSNETLATRDFDSWTSQANRNSLKWQLGHLCQKVSLQQPIDGWKDLNFIYCTLDQLNINGAVITFDTAGDSGSQGMPIIISFPNGDGANSVPDAKEILSAIAPNSQIVHVNSNRSTPRLRDFRIYGCAEGQDVGLPDQKNCRFQGITLRPGSNLRLENIFVYAPFGSILDNNSDSLVFKGAFWGNSMRLISGDSKFIIPAGAFSSVDGITTLYPSWGSQLNLAQDYIARTPIRVSSF